MTLRFDLKYYDEYRCYLTTALMADMTMASIILCISIFVHPHTPLDMGNAFPVIRFLGHCLEVAFTLAQGHRFNLESSQLIRSIYIPA